MKRVKQIHRTGCGVACIAMLAENTYENVLHVFKDSCGLSEDDSFLTNAIDLHNLGALFGLKLSKKRIAFRSDNRRFLPSKAILAINYKEEKEQWHWVVYLREKDGSDYFLDPWHEIKTERRTDFGRVNISWYLKVLSDDGKA